MWVIDPAAHGGHREADLAMLALFGAPHLEAILAAYDEHRPLAEGWRDRVGLHQLHPLLVHAALFGPRLRRPGGVGRPPLRRLMRGPWATPRPGPGPDGNLGPDPPRPAAAFHDRTP